MSKDITTSDTLARIETEIEHHLKCWRAARETHAKVREELADLEFDTRCLIMDAVMRDKEKGLFGALHPGDQSVKDFAELELRENPRWRELRNERARLQAEIDQHWSEYELLGYKLQGLLVMASLPRLHLMAAVH